SVRKPSSSTDNGRNRWLLNYPCVKTTEDQMRAWSIQAGGEQAMVSQALQAALTVYFEAKQLMFRNVPEFQIIEAGPLKCFHQHPGWPEVDAFYAVDVEPYEAIAAIVKYSPSPKHMLTVFTDSPQGQYPVYAGLGYHPLPAPQPFMSLELSAQT